MSGDRYIISDQNAIYFLTFTVIDWMDVFIRREYKEVIADDLNYCINKKGLDVFAWCLMTSHLHLVCRAREEYVLSYIIRDFKKHTARTILKRIDEGGESRKEWLLDRMAWRGKADSRIKQYKFWQESNHAVFIEPSSALLQQKIDYVHNNPVTEGTVEEPHEYLYSSARDYAGVKGLVEVVFP